MFIYCPKCGMIKKQAEAASCPVCGMEQLIVPEKYLSKSGNLFASQEKRSEFIKEVIENGAEYDAELAGQRDEILRQQQQKHEQDVAEKVEQYKATQPVHRCPVCGSTNLSAISTVGKVVKISLLGVWGAGDLGKRRHCNSCGHKF